MAGKSNLFEAATVVTLLCAASGLLLHHALRPSVAMGYESLVARAGDIAALEAADGQARGELSDGTRFVTRLPKERAAVERLAGGRARVTTSFSTGTAWSPLRLPLLLLTGALLIVLGHFARRRVGARSRHGQSVWTNAGARRNPWDLEAATPRRGGATEQPRPSSRIQGIVAVEEPHEDLNEMAGLEESFEPVQAIAQFLEDPSRFRRLGATNARSLLITGAAGTGKTRLVRAIAAEAKARLITIRGSDWRDAVAGKGTALVADIAAFAVATQPAVLLVEGLAGEGGDRLDIGAGVLTALADLIERIREDAVLVAATDREGSPSWASGGLFDRHVAMPAAPSALTREAILLPPLSRVPLAPDADPRVIAMATPGLSGAELCAIVNAAAFSAAREGKRLVRHSDFLAAVRAHWRSLSPLQNEADATAVAAIARYSAGQTLVARELELLPEDVAIVAGAPWARKLFEPQLRTAEKVRAGNILVVALAGRAAELAFGRRLPTALAEDDLSFANDIAVSFQQRWGFEGLAESMGLQQRARNEPPEGSAFGSLARNLLARRAAELGEAALERATLILESDRPGMELLVKAFEERYFVLGRSLDDLLIRGTPPGELDVFLDPSRAEAPPRALTPAPAGLAESSGRADRL